MNWLDKLERKYGGRGIRNITNYFILATLIGNVFLFFAAQGSGVAYTFIKYLQFDGSLILRGQIWRLFTWIFMPTQGLSFWELLFMFCLFSLGRSLEQGLGTFRMNVYFLGGVLFNTIAGLIVYAGTTIYNIAVSGGTYTSGLSVHLTSYYLLFALYMMLGLFMPDAEMRLYFVLPIKMKWLVIVYFVMMAYEVFSAFRGGISSGLVYATEIVITIGYLLLFVAACKSRLSLKAKRKQQKRQAQYQRQFDMGPRAGAKISHHKCSICGRTDADDSTLTFRYCSKCVGNREYCQEHLFTHEHITVV